MRFVVAVVLKTQIISGCKLTSFFFSVAQYKLPPFHGARIFIHGFSESEHEHVAAELVRNGGVECASPQDPSCTHIVIDDANVKSLPAELIGTKSKPAVVKTEWFWASIQVTFVFIRLKGWL